MSCKIRLHGVHVAFINKNSEREVPKDQVVSLRYSRVSGLALDYFLSSIHAKAENTEKGFLILKQQCSSYQHQAQSKQYLR